MRGGLCGLYKGIPETQRGYEYFDEFLWDGFGIEIGLLCFFQNGTVAVFVELEDIPPYSVSTMRKLYNEHIKNPFGNHSLGRARFKLIEDLIKRCEDEPI